MRVIVGFLMVDEGIAVPVFGWDSESMGDAVDRLTDAVGEHPAPEDLNWYEPRYTSGAGACLSLVSVDVHYTFTRA